MYHIRGIKNNLIILLVTVFIPIEMVSQHSEKDTIKLFFLGGQSNMEGHGRNDELPAQFKTENNAVWIFQGNPVPDGQKNGGLGLWEYLKPGHGAGFTSDGAKNQHSEKFGPELSFGKRIKELFPDDKIALIKYTRGGSSLDSLAAREYGSWEMDYTGNGGVNQFDHFLVTITEALKVKDFDNDGRDDILIPCGILWMQGESDAVLSEETALGYFSNLKRLIDLIRISFRNDDLPVVIGKISDSGLEQNGKVWKYGELVQYAQEKYVSSDRNAAIVRDTKVYQYSDPWHYDTDGYLRLGEKFAEAVYQLISQGKSQ